MLLFKTTMLLALAAAVPAAKPEMVRAQDPQSLVRALQSGGYQAQLGTDKVGDPMVTSGASGTNFQVFFYNCTNHRECATVQFHSGNHLTTQVTLDAINQWTTSQRFGRAHLDKDSDPILEMDVDLDDGGLSPALFIDNMEFWTSVLGNFERQIGYRK
ncbi:MAG: YbjN domain-containing protein [Sphingomicrobium sp.]